MNMRWAWTLALLSSLTVTIAASPLSAQAPYAMGGGGMSGQMAAYPMMGQPPQGYGPQQAPMSMYGQPGMMPGAMGPGGMPPGMAPGMPPGMSPTGGYGPTPDAYGAYGAAPPDMMGGGMPMGGGCPQCGGMGCEMCGGGHGHGHGHSGLLGDALGLVAPYPDGGCGAVRWFDFAVDGMYLTRESVGRNIDISSRGAAAVGGIVLSTDDLAFDYEEGFRFTAATQVGPGSNLEFTYYGLFFYDDTAIAVRTGPLATDGLFSVLSDFGTNPPGGFAETDNADLHLINYNSTFDSFELNFRQRWMAANCRYQGSWLWGARYFKLDEEFLFFSSSTDGLPPGDPARNLSYTVDTNNSLTGLQIGGDVWVCLMPGLRLGAEAKGGVYYNHMNVDSVITVNTLPLTPGINPFTEEQIQGDVAFVGDASLIATYRVNYQWTLRAGYQILFVDGVALATENFNTQPPAGPFGPLAAARVPFVDDDGNVLYHGMFAGAEFMW